MSTRHPNVISRPKAALSGASARHGHIFSPPSRAYLLWQAGGIDDGALNQRESGKFFPLTAGGLNDTLAPTDSANVAPPPDGKIASAGQATGQALDAPGRQWQKHTVYSAEVLDFSWDFTANHKTRRFNYFVTKVGWNPDQVLSREQFDPLPFWQVESALQPHWEHGQALTPAIPTRHEVPLPERVGYHVVLAVWEVADTSMAFYQVVDLDFLPAEGGGERPTAPAHLAYHDVSESKVVLTWGASSGTSPIAHYLVFRDGRQIAQVSPTVLTWTDSSVSPSTGYSYFVTAVAVNGHSSAPSNTVSVVTSAPGGGTHPRPTPPINLHTMQVTANSVELMWGPSSGALPIVKYVVLRANDGVTHTVLAPQTTFTDTGLVAGSVHYYMVYAEDTSGRQSNSSNIIRVQLLAGGGTAPAWKLNTLYTVGELVSHNAQDWRCVQTHTSYTTDWAPGSAETLWAVAP